ncbi:MAG: L-2-amino-thiazoline-4-carboxylic acid hydrolase [Lachnospiraceae bacterium]|nr:L-2-amino-thiazoline-4-carboxylic acid hydrolase [Lachnospiraceae bacterium]
MISKNQYIEKDPAEKQQFYWVGLFYFIAKTCIDLHGLKGEAAVRRGVRDYGQARGERMRGITDSLGLAPNLVNLAAHYDLMNDPRFDPDKIKVELSEESHKMLYSCCPDADMWGCLPDGHRIGFIFCEEVHHRIYGGYDPSIQVNLCETLTNGSDCCRFYIYCREANQTPYPLPPYKKQPWDDFEGDLIPSIDTIFGLMLIFMGKAVLEDLNKDALTQSIYNFGYHRGERMRELHRREGIAPSIKNFIEQGDVFLDPRYQLEKNFTPDELEIKIKRDPIAEMFDTYHAWDVEKVYNSVIYSALIDGYGIPYDVSFCDSEQYATLRFLRK